MLRVRDRVLHTGIPYIIDRVKKNPELAYLTGNAVDENGKLRLQYNKPRYLKGREALERHTSMYLHPSGSMYSLKLLDIDAEEAFIRSHIDTKFGFLSHCMMRLELAQKGDFELICDAPIWQYTNTLNSTDVAVNSDKNKISVFAPIYMEQRFLREMEWADQCLLSENKEFIFKWLIKQYLDLNTWGFKRRNEDSALQRHYNCEKMKFSIVFQREKFSKLCNDKINTLSIETELSKELKCYLNKLLLKNMLYEPIRFYLAKIFHNTIVYTIYSKKNIKGGRT